MPGGYFWGRTSQNSSSTHSDEQGQESGARMISPPPPLASAPCLALDRIRRVFFLFPQPLQPVGQFASLSIRRTLVLLASSRADLVKVLVVMIHPSSAW